MSQDAQEFVGVGEVGEWAEAPDRAESVARLIARQPTGAAQKEMAARVKRLHPTAVAERIVERARAIVRERRPVAGHARRGGDD